MPTLVIDPGHGGHDPGALGPMNPRLNNSRLQEADVVLDIAIRLKALLDYATVEKLQTYLTRTTDTFLTFDERQAFSNGHGADLFLSLHCNSAKNPAQGFEAFTTRGETGADQAATHLLKSFEQYFPHLPTRYDHSDGDPDKEAGFAVLRCKAPAVLFELNFIHTPEGDEFFRSQHNRALMVHALADGVLSYLGLPELPSNVHTKHSKPTPLAAGLDATANEQARALLLEAQTTLARASDLLS